MMTSKPLSRLDIYEMLNDLYSDSSPDDVIAYLVDIGEYQGEHSQVVMFSRQKPNIKN